MVSMKSMDLELDQKIDNISGNMNMRKFYYFYKIVPTVESIENADGRWYFERYKNYIELLFKKCNYEIFWPTQETQIPNVVAFSDKITDELKIELMQLSPNITIEFLFKKDIYLSEIKEKLKEALELSVKYEYFDLVKKLIDIDVWKMGND